MSLGCYIPLGGMLRFAQYLGQKTLRFSNSLPQQWDLNGLLFIWKKKRVGLSWDGMLLPGLNATVPSQPAAGNACHGRPSSPTCTEADQCLPRKPEFVVDWFPLMSYSKTKKMLGVDFECKLEFVCVLQFDAVLADILTL